MATLRVLIQTVIYQKESFFILKGITTDLDTERQAITTLRGYLFGLAHLKAGVALQVEGVWAKHSKYGMQFQIETWNPSTHTIAHIIGFFTSCMPAVYDAAVVSKLAVQYGMQAFDTLLKEAVPEEYGPLQRDWQRLCTIRDVAQFLRNDGLTQDHIRGVIQKFGQESLSVLRKNPYRMLEVPGIPFHIADSAGDRLGVDPEDPRRVGGAVLVCISAGMLEGHLYMPQGELTQAVSKMLDLAIDREVMTSAYRRLEEDKSIVRVSEGIYLPHVHQAEQYCAARLAIAAMVKPLNIDIPDFLQQYEKQSHITLSELQREAVLKLSQNNLFVLTGLPGTGKTTVVRTFVQLFKRAGISYQLMAPTGIAAKRLSSVTESQAFTVHRALRFDGTSWGYNDANRLVVDVVIVDEFSMVDLDLLYHLLQALPETTKLCFVGDDAQLPSVGPGAVLRDLSRCVDLPRVKLTQIFRQEDTSDIVKNAHHIYRGEDLEIFKDSKSAFKYMHYQDEDEIADRVTELACKLKERNANFQVLSPMYKGPIGVDALNLRLRDKLNPSMGQAEMDLGDFSLRVGDRVMVIQNDYVQGVYNGDVGKVRSIQEGMIVVGVHDAGIDNTDLVINYSKEQAVQRLRLAYAVTIHKCQGLEFRTIILPFTKSFGRMLQRNLLYTAVTRAKNYLWLFGTVSSANAAIANDKEHYRYSRLGSLIQAKKNLLASAVDLVQAEKNLLANPPV